jgi:tRNA (cytidine/uridine-2'-O-)-methyltransferase
LINIVLHQPEIPDNTGNIGRTCVAVGAKLWLVRPLGFRLDDRHLHRAGLDYWRHLDWEAVDDWPTLVDRLPCRRPWFFTKTAERVYTEAAFSPGDALVFGSESQGLPRQILDAQPDRCLRIPMAPEARSLNLAVAVGVAAYEALRQETLSRLESGKHSPTVRTVDKIDQALKRYAKSRTKRRGAG